MANVPDFRNILVIHFGQLGDVILGLPALRAIRDLFEHSKITLLHGKPPTEILQLASVADEYIPVDRVALRDGNKLDSIASMFRLTRDIRQRRFDLVIDLHSLFETNLLGFAAGIPHRLYANRESRSLDALSNFRPRPRLEDKAKHASARYFDVVGPLGIVPSHETLLLPIKNDDLEAVLNKYPSLFCREKSEPLIGLFPGAGNASRCWPLEKFAELARSISEDGQRPVVFLGPEEVAIRPAIESMFPSSTAVVDGLTLPRFLAALSRMDLFISNDTGPVHLAACAGIPIVLLLDERAPTTYLPNSDRLTTIRQGTITAIEVETVYRAVCQVLLDLTTESNDKRC